ncbi:MAG: hypothetical protein HC896_03310 [Bacteroidales bacterium]|nr:hypothetical protein [Bacteroidales bacterium]
MGGSDNTAFYLSGSYLDREGIIAPSNYKRYSLKLNLESKINKTFTIGIKSGYAFHKKRTVPTGLYQTEGIVSSALLQLPFLPAYDDFGRYYLNPLNPQLNVSNAIADGYLDNTKRSSYSANVYLKVHLLKNLQYYVSGSGNLTLDHRNLYLYNDRTYLGVQNFGLSRGEDYENYITNLENYLSYSTAIKSHEFAVNAGYIMHRNKYSGLGITGVNYSVNLVKTLDKAGSFMGQESPIYEHEKNSFVGNMSYRFKNKYMLDLGVRLDNTSRFEQEKYYMYPSMSLAWKISEESFMKSQSFISNLQLNAGYGISGNDGGLKIGYNYPFTYLYQDSIATTYRLNPDERKRIDSLPGLNRSAINDLKIKPEQTTQLSFGIDVGFLKNRLNLAATYHIKKTQGLILPYVNTADTTLGLGNLGEMEGNFIDFSMSSLIFAQPKFRWNAELVLSMINTEITALTNYDDEAFGLPSINSAIQGQPLNAMVDENNKVIGNPNPNIVLGFNNVVRVGDFELTLLLQGSFGAEAINVTNIYLTEPGTYTNKLKSFDPNANPTLESYVEGASYLMVKNAALAYYIPQKLMNKLQVAESKIFVSAENLYTFSDYSGYGPENSMYGYQGIDWGMYPNVKKFIVGIDISF